MKLAVLPTTWLACGDDTSGDERKASGEETDDGVGTRPVKVEQDSGVASPSHRLAKKSDYSKRDPVNTICTKQYVKSSLTSLSARG